MQTDAIVNTANALPTVGPGCDHAIYKAAGQDDLPEYHPQKLTALCLCIGAKMNMDESEIFSPERDMLFRPATRMVR